MPRRYPPHFRRDMVRRILAGESVLCLVQETSVPEQTLHRWKHQALVDQGTVDGVNSTESAQLRAANKRIKALGKELQLVKDASELFDAQAVVPPKRRQATALGLVRRGHSIRSATQISGVNRSTFGYRTRPKPPGNREIRRLLVADTMGQVHEDSRAKYGYRRVQAALRIERDLTVNHKLVATVMANLGLTGLPRRKTRKRNLISVRTSSDLVNRNFTADQPNQLWVTDITEHPTKEGNVYACVVLDVFSRKAVGWAVDRRPETSLVNSALFMAYSSRQPVGGGIIHADHGAQGGFNRSSQHFGVMEVCDGSSSTGSRSCDSTEDEVAWFALSSA